jgi:hypothetical protein
VLDLPAPVAPERIMPPVEMPTAPPPPHEQYVVLDTPGDHAKVEATERAFSAGQEVDSTRSLCVTPCVASLREGLPYLFSFTSTSAAERTSIAEVRVEKSPLVVRHALGESRPNSMFDGGVMALVWGAAPLLAGAIATPVGMAYGNSGVTTIGVGLLAGGGLLIALAIGWMAGGRPVLRPGATTQWTLAPTEAP